MQLNEARERFEVTKCDLSGSTFSEVNLSGSTYENINLSGASFDNVNLSGWRLHNVNFAGARIGHANLSGVTIADSRLDGMTIDGIAVTDLLAAYKILQEEKAGKAAADAQGKVRDPNWGKIY
jgi:uncharacterized protein YjbI with pentapeptide repeats